MYKTPQQIQEDRITELEAVVSKMAILIAKIVDTLIVDELPEAEKVKYKTELEDFING